MATLADADPRGGASWSSQGTLAFQAQALRQVSQEGGTPQSLTQGVKEDIFHRWPDFLPGGTAVLFAASSTNSTWNNAQIIVQPLGSGDRRELVQGGTQPRYATGHLLYARIGTLMAAPFDSRQLMITGASVRAIEGVMQSPITGAAQYGVSSTSTGTLIYLAGGLVGSDTRLAWVGRDGKEQLLPPAPRPYQFPRLSPDGSRIAVSIADEVSHVWLYDISRDTLTRLTFEGSDNTTSAWSPDGQRIAFRSKRDGAPSIFAQASDGSGAVERLTTADYPIAPNSFSPDGKWLAFMEQTPETGRDIWVLSLKDRKAEPFLNTSYEEAAPKFSPNGNWLAYSSDESGRREIYVQPYPGPGGKLQISNDGGQEPVWNPKGGELFYRSGSKVMSVAIDTESGFSAGNPRMLFEGPYVLTSGSFPFYDVSPDGERFLMLKPVESQAAAPTQIHVVLNWFEELKQKIP